MSELLKFARIRNDVEFVSRVGAAMSLHAQAIEPDGSLTNSARLLVNWVLDNPLEVPWPMLAQVITNGTVAENVTLENDVITGANVPDNDIKYVVGATWNTVADLIYSPSRSRSAGNTAGQTV